MHSAPATPLAKDRAQRDSWQAIMDLSVEISTLVEQHDWTRLIDLAEQRDLRVAAFLAQSIPVAMYTQVMLDIDQLKQQHTLISSELARQQQHTEEKERQLRRVRAELTAKAAIESGTLVESDENVLDRTMRH
jgi:hypothetical protein